MSKGKDSIDYFSAITWSPWTAGSEADEIVGRWAEDNSAYYISCPEQLRDLLIEIQNALHVQYDEIEQLRKKLAEAERRSTLWRS